MLWAKVGKEIKKKVGHAALELEMPITEFVLGAVLFRLSNEETVKNFVDSIPKMEYDNSQNELTELLSDGDTQPPAPERE